MSITENKAVELAEVIYAYLARLDADCLSAFLADWPSKPFKMRAVTPSTLPVLSYLSGLAVEADSDAGRIVEILKASAGYLKWGQTYSADDFGVGFLNKYGWTELIGLRGPIKSEAMASGFLLLGPGVEYVKHSHEAEEVYVPFVSETLWAKGDGDWVSMPIGLPIYHDSWVTHGMRTENSPLLALYLWRGGDLTQKSRIHL